MSSTQQIFFAILGGILPALFWLWLWLKEDWKNPEPRWRIATTFLAGMIAVLVVLPFEKIVYGYFAGSLSHTFLLWAALEEICKYSAAALIALGSRDADEPIDDVIYLLTAALGFAALENTLFLINPHIAGSTRELLVLGNLRFLGSSLLHILSTSVIGIFIAFSFYKSKFHKIIAASLGLVLAIALHTFFNLFIISNNGNETYATIGIVWLGIPLLMVFFERIKTLSPLQ